MQKTRSLQTNHGSIGRLALAMAFLLPLTGGASAETPARIAQAWGLIGSWSADCSLPPDRDRGTVLTYEIGPDKRLALRRAFGDTTDGADVVDAAVSRDGLLNLRVVFSPLSETREYGLKRLADGTIRAIYNRNEKGEYTIRDGRFIRDNRPTPPQHKCE